MIYLDNSSTTRHKPLAVKLATYKGVSSLSVNPSRAGYKIALKAAEKVFSCREKLANMLGTSGENVVFTSGCTMALNLAIKGTVRKNGHIIATIFEHNSVLRTLEELKNTDNITYSLVTPNKQGQITVQEIQKHITNHTYMIITNHTSNVTGDTQNIESIGKFCKKNNYIYLVDGAQSIGHEQINMEKMNINLLTVAGHKGLYSPQGIGALLINNVSVSPIIFGGTGTFSDKLKQPREIPEGLESGTPNTVGILGLLEGIKFVKRNQKNINKKITKLTSFTINKLNRIKNVNCYSTNINSGVVSFTINNITSTDVSDILSTKYNIATRSGLHCAPMVHKYYNTIKNGMTRVSISYYNNLRELKKLIKAIEEIALG